MDKSGTHIEHTNKKQHWNRWYLAVFGVLVLQIVFYYLFTRFYQ